MLSRTSEYAMRAAIVIARRESDGRVPAKTIAAEARVPLKYLHKVLRDLVRHGVLRSGRGLGGGYVLNQPAEDICLHDIVTPFTEKVGASACPFGNADCGEGEPCPVHAKWLPVMVAYRRFLETTRLADLVATGSFGAGSAPSPSG